jgi:DNA helicase-2/ATP-dependent DNA helicase PcrA
VPYQIVRGLAFYERKENRDVLAYLRLLVNPRDELSFERAIGEPARGVGPTSLRYLREYAEPREMSLLSACERLDQIPAIRGKAAAGLRSFHALMTELRRHRDDPPDELIRLVLDRSGYRKMLQDSNDEDDQERLANIEELITAAKQFAAEDPNRTIGDFLEQITLASDVDGWDESSDCVSVMTLHAAKGLEFPVVTILAMEQGLLPHERSLPTPEDLEEERRLCYVGMTRAKEELILSHARMREFRGRSLYTVPSMFLDELPAEGIEHDDLSGAYRSASLRAAAPVHAADDDPDTGRPGPDGLAVGVIVDHASYGRGKVLDLSGHGALRRARIRFARHGEKVFVVQKAQLTVVIDD